MVQFFQHTGLMALFKAVAYVVFFLLNYLYQYASLAHAQPAFQKMLEIKTFSELGLGKNSCSNIVLGTSIEWTILDTNLKKGSELLPEIKAWWCSYA